MPQPVDLSPLRITADVEAVFAAMPEVLCERLLEIRALIIDAGRPVL